MENKRRVFIVHGWSGRPDSGWMKWLNSELTKKGFKVIAKRMPDPDYPKINDWVSYLSKEVGKVDQNTFFVGHSIGCQTIIRYLESLNENSKIGGAIFVAGWFNLNSLETEEEKEVATPWVENSINFIKVKKIINKSFALFSDNDPYVPISNSDLFKNNLGSKIKIEKGKGHYIENETLEIPIILKEAIRLFK